MLSLLLLGILGVSAWGQPAEVLPPGDEKPFPRTEADGPTSFVTAAALSPDGRTLYVAGLDKVVHVWRLNGQGRFVIDREGTYRVPIGPGLEGSLNALAISPDGEWLAVAGQGMARGSMSYRTVGFIMKRIPREALRDRGLIYVFNTRTRAVKLLRGHEGQVISLAFAANSPAPRLLSAAVELLEDGETEVGCLRTWDVERGANLATLRNLPKTGVRPGLAFWKTGDELKAALAWDDGKFRVWDGQKLQAVEDGEHNVAVANLPDRNLALTTSYQNSEGRVQGWMLGEAAPRSALGVQATFKSVVEDNQKTRFYPRALTLFASKRDGRLDHAAVILRSINQASQEDDRLQILHIGLTGQLKPLLNSPIVVARGGRAQPVLAASGRHLVVAGNRAHEVLVFTIDELIKNPAQATPQVLRSNAETIRYASFVKKGNERGLVLSTLAKAKPGGPRQQAADDLLFDFGARKLGKVTAGWQVDTPPTSGWSVEVKGAKVIASQGGKAVSTIDLKGKQFVTDFAILPGNPPLLALATFNFLEPQLALHDLRTGQMLQRLIGHTGLVRSLAFAGDGKLLVSTGEDQTICVWTLADFAKVLNRNGTIDGLAVRQVGKDLVVGEVETGSAAQGKLKTGDIIEGIVEAGQLKPTASEFDFHLATWQIKPGSTVTLRVRNRGDLVLPVSQGVETRNPLFYMFITRGPIRDWLAWSPIGHYDASRPEVERNLGWHFNTGKPDAPTRFAEVGQYKKEYHRPDLLKHMVARGKLDRALEEWEREEKEKKSARQLPEPRINLRLAEAGPDPLRLDGEVMVRETPQSLRLAIDNFSAEDVGSVTWSIPGLAAEPRPFAAGLGREYTADVSTLPWQRGAWKIRVEIQTREETPRKYIQELPVRYQPLPPEVEAPSGRQIVEKEKFPFQATVKPGVAGQAVRVRLSQHHQGKEVFSKLVGNQVNEEITLKPGLNLIEVVASNLDVPAGMQELETTRRVVEVTYRPPTVPDPQPIITLESIQPKNGRRASANPIVPGQPVVVDTATVVLRGKIEATKELTRSDIARDGQAARKLTGLKAEKAGTVAFSEELKLTPGSQRYRITASTAKSDPAESTVTIVFRPQLPQLVLIEPEPGLILYEGQKKAEVEVRFQLIDFQPDYPFETSVLVNDRPAVPRVEAKVDQANHTLSATVPLAHGDNRIQVRLKNAWGAEQAAEDIVVVRYLKPPQIVQLNAPAESEQSLVDVTATVASALPLLPGSVDAEVSNTATGTRRRISTFEVMKGAQDWIVRLRDVPLEPGNNEVRLAVSNSDARVLNPATRTIVYKKVPPPPAVVEMLDPSENISTTDRELTLAFRVNSTSPLRRLELVQLTPVVSRQAIDVSRLPASKDRPLDLKLKLKLAGTGPRPAIDPAKLTADPQGFLEASAGLGLTSGTNSLRVEAVNEGGQTDASLVVTVVRRPVQLEFVQLTPRGGGAPILAEKGSNNEVRFPPIPQGRVNLSGRVVWDYEDDDQLKLVNTVQVYVNGLRQPAVRLDMPGGKARERTFSAPLNLTATNNIIEVELPGLAQDRSVRNQVQVDCQNPEKQRVHLLIVGVGEESPQDLVGRVLKGLHATDINLEQRRFSLPNFAEGRLYPPLVGFVRPGHVHTRLRQIKDEIDLLSRGGSTSDVVMVYFAGEKGQQDQENYCLTSVSQDVQDLSRSGLAFSSLEACLGDILGAQVLFLDVTQTGNPVNAGGAGNYLDRSRVGLVCYEWAQRPTGSAKYLSWALDQAMEKSATLGDVVRALQGFASQQQTALTYRENITGSKLTVMPLGAMK